MGISHAEAETAQAAIEDLIFKDPNVVSIGVVKEVNSVGKKTGDYAVRVGVISSKIYLNSLKNGTLIIPSAYILPKNNTCTLEQKRINIHVIEEGIIQALDSNLPKAVSPIYKNNALEMMPFFRLKRANANILLAVGGLGLCAAIAYMDTTRKQKPALTS